MWQVSTTRDGSEKITNTNSWKRQLDQKEKVTTTIIIIPNRALRGISFLRHLGTAHRSLLFPSTTTVKCLITWIYFRPIALKVEALTMMCRVIRTH
jgi:hypothetical protein